MHAEAPAHRGGRQRTRSSHEPPYSDGPNSTGCAQLGDDDGVVAVPHEIAEEVLAEAEGKAATESEIRVAVRDGMAPLDAYERYGTF